MVKERQISVDSETSSLENDETQKKVSREFEDKISH